MIRSFRKAIPQLVCLVPVLVLPALLSGQTLLNFEGAFDPGTVERVDATVRITNSASGSCLRVVTGHSNTWPGVTLKAPAGHWDLSEYAYVALDVRNPGDAEVTVNCRVDNPGADGREHCVTGSTTIPPGRSRVMRVDLPRHGPGTLGGKLFGMRGYPVSSSVPGAIIPSNVVQLVVFVNKPAADHTIEIDNIRGEGAYVPPTASISDADPFFPFIDALGQYQHKDWPGKVRSLPDLQKAREREAAELAKSSGPEGWNRYGGWDAGPRLQATGFFRTEKYRGKWWLVDPQGRLFFSHGIDCVLMLDSTPIDERDAWFEDFPGAKPEFGSFVTPAAYALKGHYAGKSPRSFCFAGANLRRKYGPDWRKSCPAVVHQRLRSWGLNTIGMWSDEATRLLRKTPYVDAVGSAHSKMIEGSEGYWSKFPDVFDPAFKAGVRQSMAGMAGRSAEDPWCIGYFADNEMSWGDELSLAVAALLSPPEQAAKKVFVADLKAKYEEIGKLNAAWGARYESWDDLLAKREQPSLVKAKDDLAAFYTRLAEEYFRIVKEAIKAVAPHQLYLGCRFAWANARAAAAAAKYCDVVSYNLYQRGVAGYQFSGGADVPLIIGEFHFGALDRGMFHTGLAPTASQSARAEAYRNYVEEVARHPSFVGCHWFQYQDEPTTGRVYDEENYQIGFVDVADTPYRETIDAARTIAGKLYSLRLGAE